MCARHLTLRTALLGIRLGDRDSPAPPTARGGLYEREEGALEGTQKPRKVLDSQEGFSEAVARQKVGGNVEVVLKERDPIYLKAVIV